MLTQLNSMSTYCYPLILQDAWEDVDPDELSYEVNLINIKVYIALPTLLVSLSCFKNRENG